MESIKGAKTLRGTPSDSALPEHIDLQLLIRASFNMKLPLTVVQQPIDNDGMKNEIPKYQINPDDEDKGLKGQENELTNDLVKSYEDYHESNVTLQASLDQDIKETVSMDEILKVLFLSSTSPPNLPLKLLCKIW